MLVNAMADKISKGELSSVVCSGCEDMASLTAALGSDEDKDTLAANWIDARPEDAPPVRVGPEDQDSPRRCGLVRMTRIRRAGVGWSG